MLNSYKVIFKFCYYTRQECKKNAKKSAIRFFLSMSKYYLKEYLKNNIKAKLIKDDR